jgi:chemotaxis protein methyltransferase CheR
VNPSASMEQVRRCSTAIADGRIPDSEFAAIAAMVRQATGIVLGATKRDLVFGRLSRRLRALGLNDFAAYRALVEGPDGQAEREMMVNALTTNLTGFFREAHHFQALAEDVLPGLLASATGRERIRIWSAACSSGEEPYSIAMVLHKALGEHHRCDARILATDIDTNMVGIARAGRYEAERVAPVPGAYRSAMRRGKDGMVEMADSVKNLITFNPLNLLEAWPMRGPFDVIFCRNVVIYFDKETQRRLFDRFADIMAPNGRLFIGHSETLFRVCDRFENLGRTMYRKIR